MDRAIFLISPILSLLIVFFLWFLQYNVDSFALNAALKMHHCLVLERA